MGSKITWIGWELNFSAGGFRLPADKRAKAIALLESCFSKKLLDKVLGLMQWILQCAPELRPWLCCLYDNMRRPLGTSFRAGPSEWPSLSAHLSDSLRVVSTPRGTDIPVGSTLLSARHKSLSCKADLRLVPISSRRIWMRIADPASSRRRLSGPSVEMLQFLLLSLCPKMHSCSGPYQITLVRGGEPHSLLCHLLQCLASTLRLSWGGRWCLVHSLSLRFSAVFAKALACFVSADHVFRLLPASSRPLSSWEILGGLLFVLAISDWVYCDPYLVLRFCFCVKPSWFPIRILKGTDPSFSPRQKEGELAFRCALAVEVQH